MLDRVEKILEEKTGLFGGFLPVPAELVGTTAPLREVTDQTKALVEKYGAADWYDWSINNWGTKWDVEPDGYSRPNPNSLSVGFETAWAPPIQFYEHLESLGFHVEAMYYEPGMAFAGIYTTDGGEEHYDYSGMDSIEVKDNLPTVLDEEFGISEQLAEWEENEE
jgi:hypothetical protein